MIFGKRPPRVIRRHLETETAADTRTSGDDAGSQVIRTPPMKPFARATVSATPVPVSKLAAKAKPPAPRRPAADLVPAKPAPRATDVITRPSRNALPDSRQIPGHTLVVGRDIRLTGEIRACQRLIVEGSVEAELTDTRTLEIADTGYFRGRAAVGNCVISGSFDGDLTVSGLLAVRAGGRVGGAIRYAEIEVERGGRITGRADLQGPQEVHPGKGPAEPPRAGSGPGLRPA
jgi:cytoskeletal protein CcmA (bactofilin family)